MSPVIARLPMAWQDPAYRKARRAGHASAALTAVPGTADPPFLTGDDGQDGPDPWHGRDTPPAPILPGGSSGRLSPYPWQ